jgi:hypothetical protein
MTAHDVRRNVKVGGRFGVRGSSKPAGGDAGLAVQASVIEELESRLLLSAAPVATHNFFVHHRAGANQYGGSASMTGMTAAQIRQAYGINDAMFGSVVGDGSGQTIAIVDAYNDPNIKSDLAAFDTAMGLAAAPSFTVVGETGTSGLPSTDPAGKGDSWAVEISLDVEWAHAVAPGASILLVEASSASDSDLFSAINTARNYSGVSVVSMSWGETEFSGETSYDSYFTTPAGHTGVTFLAASGDNGAYGSGWRSIAADYPSSSPNVISVGGTTLTADSSGNYISESGWGNGNSSGTEGGSGGGISVYEAQPVYQNGVVTQSTTHRTTPDVAMDADPNTGAAVYDSWDFGSSTPWAQIGGTSMSTPMFAGVIAIADQGSVLAGQGIFGGQTALTKLYALPSSDFHDITTGNNGYAAGAGYDLVTGRGSPVVNLMVAGLAGPITPVPVIGSLKASPTSGLAGTSVTLTASNVQESSGSPTISTVTFYLENNATPGLAGATLLGTGTPNGTTWTYAFDTTGLATGTYTFYATATDSSSVVSAVASTSFQVVVPVPEIGSLTASPTSGSVGTSVTLTASNVKESIGSTAISTVTFYLENNATPGLAGATLLGTGTQSGMTWTYSYVTTGLSSGTHTFYATATDADSVVSAVASTTFKVVAPAPPVPKIGSLTASPTSGLAGTSVTLTAANVLESNASATISSVKFYLGGRQTRGVWGGGTLLGTGTQNGTTWTYAFSTTGLSTGTYRFYAVATDSNGVASSPASTTFKVVVPVPTIGSLTASPTSGLAGTSVTLTAANVVESIGSTAISTVTFYLGGNGGRGGLRGGGATVLGTGTQSGTTWTYTLGTTGLSTGRYTFYAVATDANDIMSAAAMTTFKVVVPVPTIGSLTASPTSGPAGTSATLTASNVVESIGTTAISTVTFYVESNSFGRRGGDGSGNRNAQRHDLDVHVQYDWTVRRAVHDFGGCRGCQRRHQRPGPYDLPGHRNFTTPRAVQSVEPVAKHVFRTVVPLRIAE